MTPWRRLNSTRLVCYRWLTLRADECQLPSGKTLSPYYVLEERDWVHVFARSADRRVLTVTQYRYAADAVCLELPGGVVDDGETPEAAARRELLEETGFGTMRAFGVRCGVASAPPPKSEMRGDTYDRDHRVFGVVETDVARRPTAGSPLRVGARG